MLRDQESGLMNYLAAIETVGIKLAADRIRQFSEDTGQPLHQVRSGASKQRGDQWMTRSLRKMPACRLRPDHSP